MISFRFIYLLLIISGTTCWGLPLFGQISDPLQKEAEKTLRQKINTSRADTVKIQAELDLAQLYLCAGISKPRLLDTTMALNSRAEVLSRQLNSTKWLNEVLKSKAACYFEKGDLTNGKKYIIEIVNSAPTSTDLVSRANTWRETGREISAWSIELFEGKILCFNEAKKLLASAKHNLDVLATTKDIVEAHLRQGKLDLAENELFQLLAQYHAIHFQKLSGVYHLISQLYRFRGNMHQALFYGLETIKNMEATGDRTNANVIYVRIATLYEDLGMYDDATFYYKKMLNSNPGDDVYRIAAIKHMVIILIRENKKKEAFELLRLKVLNSPVRRYISNVNIDQTRAICYLSLGQYQQAGIYIDKMLQDAGNFHYLLSNPREASLSVYNLACRYFLATKRFQLAKFYSGQLLEIPETEITPAFRSDMEMYQSKIDSADGKYVSALKHFQRFKFLSDSILNITKSNQIEELQISFKTRQKDADLTLLKKQSQVQQTSIANKNLLTKFIITGFVLLAVVLAVIIAALYYRFLIKKRHNLVLENTQREIAAKNHFLEKLLADNEWLLREVHHRVKNNLHVIMGLLQSQAAFLEDGIALNAVRDSRNRVQSMALIHQKLYMTTSTAEIYLPEFVTELVDNLKDSFEIGVKIYFHLEIAQILMDTMYVVPVGLILNEAITNAIKHAFPCGERDTINISLTVGADNEVSIVIADNGKGMNQDIDTDLSKSFGLQLISGLVRELDGELTMKGPPGTTLLINFTIDLASRTY